MTAEVTNHGISLANGCTIVSVSSASTRRPFTDIPVTIREFSKGTNDLRPAYQGQSGLIDFDTRISLPRHVHISTEHCSSGKPVLLHERIYVLGGVALVELGGELYVIPPRSLVTIAPGVPHTWTACPAGVEVSCGGENGQDRERIVAEGKFLMVYEYEGITGFFPTSQTETLKSVEDYVRCDDLDSIRIPALTADDVRERCRFI